MANIDLYPVFRTALEAGMPIPEENWAHIRASLKIRHYHRGDYIIREGEIENHLSVVATGCVRHYVLKADEEISFEFAFEGEFSNSYASFLSRTPSRFFIQALEEVNLVSIHHDRLQELYEDSAFGERLGRLATEGYYIYREERELALLTLTAEERYLELISQDPIYVNRIPQKYLASYLNVKPESLSRIKKRIYGQRDRT